MGNKKIETLIVKKTSQEVDIGKGIREGVIRNTKERIREIQENINACTCTGRHKEELNKDLQEEYNTLSHYNS